MSSQGFGEDQRVELCTSVVQGVGTFNSASTYSRRMKPNMAAALIIEAISGGASVTGKLQHSPSPSSVADGAAVWLDMPNAAFAAQTAVGGIGPPSPLSNVVTYERKRGQFTVSVSGQATVTIVIQ